MCLDWGDFWDNPVSHNEETKNVQTICFPLHSESTVLAPSVDLRLRLCSMSKDREALEAVVEVDLDEECLERRWLVLAGVILVRRTDSAAPQSVKAMAAHFHNFILECVRSLTLYKNKSKQNNTEDRLQGHL